MKKLRHCHPMYTVKSSFSAANLWLKFIYFCFFINSFEFLSTFSGMISKFSYKLTLSLCFHERNKHMSICCICWPQPVALTRPQLKHAIAAHPAKTHFTANNLGARRSLHINLSRQPFILVFMLCETYFSLTIRSLVQELSNCGDGRPWRSEIRHSSSAGRSPFPFVDLESEPHIR